MVLASAQVAIERQLAKAAASEKADIEASLEGLTTQVGGVQRLVALPTGNDMRTPTAAEG